jgi:hypothetical protein
MATPAPTTVSLLRLKPRVQHGRYAQRWADSFPGHKVSILVERAAAAKSDRCTVFVSVSDPHWLVMFNRADGADETNAQREERITRLATDAGFAYQHGGVLSCELRAKNTQVALDLGVAALARLGVVATAVLGEHTR